MRLSKADETTSISPPGSGTSLAQFLQFHGLTESVIPAIDYLGIDADTTCTIVRQRSNPLFAIGPEGPDALWSVSCYGDPYTRDDDFSLSVDVIQKKLVSFCNLGESRILEKQAVRNVTHVFEDAALERVRTAAHQFFQVAGIFDIYVQWERAETHLEEQYGWVKVSIQRYVNNIPCMSSISANVDPTTLHILDFTSDKFFPPTSIAHTLTEQDARTLAQRFFQEHSGYNRVDSAKLIIAQPTSQGLKYLDEKPLEMRVCWSCTLEVPEEDLFVGVDLDANTGEITDWYYRKGED
jgi:hypothetical protein